MRRYRVVKSLGSFYPEFWSWSEFLLTGFWSGWEAVLMNDPLTPEHYIAARYPNIEQAKQAIDRHASQPKNVDPKVVYEVRK